jgi:Tfp pilus assembly protein FimT
MNHVKNRQVGFTLIELMLSMVFVSVLLISIAMTVIQIGDIYNRGITSKEVNQAGRAISDELQTSIADSTAFDINPGSTSRYIAKDWGGRLCIGKYSYIWNYGKNLQTSDNQSLNHYVGSNQQIRFVKVQDQSASYCLDSTKAIDPTNATELLAAGERNLAIHQFKISSQDSAADSRTNQRLYSIQFSIGTNDIQALNGINDNSGEVTCKAPNEAGSDLSYCAVGQFNIVARASNSLR